MRFFLQTVSNNSPYSFINRAIVININGLIVEKFSATKELAVRVDNFLHPDFYKPSPVFIRNDNLKSAVAVPVRRLLLLTTSQVVVLFSMLNLADVARMGSALSSSHFWAIAALFSVGCVYLRKRTPPSVV